MTARQDLRKFAWLDRRGDRDDRAGSSSPTLLTDSVGLLSDAAESLVNLVAAIVALIALTVAMRPADDTHNYGHSKAEYFSAAVEGLMIFVAAAVILVASIERFINPAPLENVGIGLVISVVASVVNGLVAWVLIRAGTKHRSITLTADGKHLLTDVWTSVGVVVGVLLVWLTGWERLDPIIAFLVGLNIIRVGFQLMRESVSGLMDKAPEPEVMETIHTFLARHEGEHVQVHAVRAREAGHRVFVSMHVLVPGVWTVAHGHDLCEEIERGLEAELPDAEVVTHLEPVDDPRSYEEHLGVEPLQG